MKLGRLAATRSEAFPDVGPQLCELQPVDLVPLLEKPKSFPNDLTRGVVKSALHLFGYERFELLCEGHVHKKRVSLDNSRCQNLLSPSQLFEPFERPS